MSQFRTLCQTDEILAGQAKMFVLGDLQIGVFNIDGEYYAVDNRCPHAGASLAHGIIKDCSVSCRIHHWKFDLQNGRRLDEVSQTDRLKRYPVRVVDHAIQIAVDD